MLHSSATMNKNPSKKKFTTISHENFLIFQEALKNQTIYKKENFPRNDLKILDFFHP